jgi:hypothetical protein
MSESFRTTPPDQPWSSTSPGDPHQSDFNEKYAHDEEDGGETGRVVLIGVLGGLLSAAAYMIYRRLPDEQKERINGQVRTIVQQRISEIRQNLNI